MEINTKDHKLTPSPTWEVADSDLEQMNHEELILEHARLQRSQGGNPNEELWGSDLFARLKKVQSKLESISVVENTKGADSDLEQMNHEELILEHARLQRSQGGNPNEELWGSDLFARLKKVQSKLEI